MPALLRLSASNIHAQLASSAPIRAFKCSVFAPVRTLSAVKGSDIRVVVMGKKKGGKKKGGNKKAGGALGDLLAKKEAAVEAAASVPEPEPYTQAPVIMHSLQLIESYKKATGEPIMQGFDISTAAKALWDADFMLLSHGRGDNPTFDYANKNALEAFEMTWQQMTETPSRNSAADSAEVQTERTQLLEQAEKEGVCTGYSGLRVSSTGRELRIEEGTIWTLRGPEGEKVGQAAMIPKWRYTDAPEESEDPVSQAPTQDDIDEAQRAVQVQGDRIRSLKAEGFTNKDPEVLVEVELLQTLKASLEELTAQVEASASS